MWTMPIASWRTTTNIFFYTQIPFYTHTKKKKLLKEFFKFKHPIVEIQSEEVGQFCLSAWADRGRGGGGRKTVTQQGCSLRCLCRGEQDHIQFCWRQSSHWPRPKESSLGGRRRPWTASSSDPVTQYLQNKSINNFPFTPPKTQIPFHILNHILTPPIKVKCCGYVPFHSSASTMEMFWSKQNY